MQSFWITIPLLLLPSSPDTSLKDVESLLSQERYQKNVERFASDDFEGRATGSAGQRAAGTLIVNHFKKIGLEPVGDEKTYYQRFFVTTNRQQTVKPTSTLTIEGPAGKKEFHPREATPFNFSGAGEAAGPVVFVGYSLTAEEQGYDDYAGMDVRGKIVLGFRHSPGESNPKSMFATVQQKVPTFERKARSAQNAGAAGLILVQDMNHEKDEPFAFNASAPESKIPVFQMQRDLVIEWFKSANYDLAKMQRDIDTEGKPHSVELKGLVAKLDAQIQRSGGGQLPTENVVGLLRGSDPELSKEFVVVGAHYDHVGFGHYGTFPGNKGKLHPGADDNASGSCGLLELAAALAAEKPHPKRSILFIAFSGEEMGLYGSKHYVESPIVPLKDTVAMVNMDMIGRSVDGACEIAGTGSAKEWEDLTSKFNQDIGLNLSFDPTIPNDSDHYPFAQKNIPVFVPFTGFHPDYHKPADTSDKINFKDAIRILKLTLRVTDTLANQAARFQFVNPSDKPGRR